jgi:squalene-hopene cyclase-like protein
VGEPVPGAAASTDVRFLLVLMPTDPPWIPSRYRGALSTRHVAAVARVAMAARGFQPDLSTVDAAVAAEVARRKELVGSVLPARWPELARVWPDHAGPAAGRLAATLALGERHASVLLAVAGDGGAASDVGLLGGLFNAVVSTLDHLCDAGDDRLLAALTPPALRSLLGDEAERAAMLDDLRRAAGDRPRARVAVELIGAWLALAARLRASSGNEVAWTALCSVLQSLLAAQRTVTGASVAAGHADLRSVLAATRHKSEGPSVAIAAMVALARPATNPPPPSVPLAAARLGRVFCLADDMVDIVDDARAGRPNVLLLHAHPGGGRLTDPDVYAAIDGAAAELTAAAPAGDQAADDFAREVTTRWLRWDEHERPGRGPVSGQDAAGAPAARSALAVLLDHRASGYSGSAHRLTVPRGPAGARRRESHSDLVFARAVALDALIDAFEAGLPVDYSLLCAEAMQLLLAKHGAVRGGWSYLRSIPELPPDADDLAQVMRVLARLGGRPLAAACDEAARLALDGAEATGGIPTWIVDHRRGGPVDVEMYRYVEVVGGGGVHPEVVANLLSALSYADPSRYGRAIASGACYLAGTQQPDGSWTSGWYAGPYYGTFRASAVLAATTGWPAHCAQARSFLLERQRANGGWDTGERANLSTAFAVLGLSALDPLGCAAAIAAGAERLRATQRPGGSWPAAPWIAFPTRDGPVSYRSEAVTTAFCLSALLAAA